MKISTESLAAIIGGGISFSTPNEEEMGGNVRNGHHYVLHNDPEDEWFNWSPILDIGDIPDRLQKPKQEKGPRNTRSSSSYL